MVSSCDAGLRGRRRRLCCGFWICSAAVVDLRLLRPCLLKPRPGNRELRGVRGRVFVNRGRAMAGIERVVYRSGFVKRVREAASLPAITFEATDLPEDVVALVDAHLLDLGGTYGVPEAGDPIQY